MPDEQHQTIIPISFAGKRLDQVLSELFSDYSRSKIKFWIEEGMVRVSGELITKPRHKVQGLEDIELTALLEPQVEWQAEAIDVDIVHEDDSILVINKSPDMVVHPAAGNYEGTLVNALLHHCPELENLPRAGIVHRLDKQTSGLLVVAKTLQAHTHLVNQLQARTVSRTYLSLVSGIVTAGGTVDEPIGRHPRKRKQMAVVSSGKPAVTHYRVLERFPAHTLLEVKLETGRTHQIRVHMAFIKHPLVGDPVYGGRFKLPKGAGKELIETLQSFKRQALHATELSFEHPETKEWVSFKAEMPMDMQQVLTALRDDLEAGHD